MLNQELLFRTQLFELHQLYRAQITVTKDFNHKDFNHYSLHKGGISPVPAHPNTHFKCSMKQPSTSMEKPLDLQLSADDFISQCVDDSSGIGLVTGGLKPFVGSNDSGRGKLVYDPDHLNLSLSTGQDASNQSNKGGEPRTCKGKNTSTSSIGVINLEDSNLSFSNYEPYRGLTSKSCSRDKYKLHSLFKSGKQILESFPQSVILNGSYGTSPSTCTSLVDAGPSRQMQSTCHSGFNGRPRKFVPANRLTENQRSLTCKVNSSLDLNTVQLEDLSYFSNNHSVVINSINSSSVFENVCPKSNVASSVSPDSWREEKFSLFMEMLGIDQQKDANFEHRGEKCSKDSKFREGSKANISIIDLDSDSDSSEELSSSRSDPKISDGLSCEMDMVDAVRAEANLNEGAEPSQQPICCKLSISSESGVVNHHSSSLKTMQSGVQCDNIKFNTSEEGGKISRGPLTTQSGEQDLRSSDSTESTIPCIIRKEPEVDGTIENAAELLVQISLDTRACCQGESAKTPLKKFQNEENYQPQCSSESYEAMVLRAEECTSDDYGVYTNAFVVDESEKKDVRYKLKRGTRMKDFQKDILPGLSTLSRQEIREDINILEGVIRSREYKKMRAMLGDRGSDLCKSTRSKRSRISRRY